MATSPYNRRNNPMAGKTGAMHKPAMRQVPPARPSVPRGTKAPPPMMVKGKMPMPPPMPRRPRG